MKLLSILLFAFALTACQKPGLCDFDKSGDVTESDLAAQAAATGQVSDIYDVTGDGLVTGEDFSICMGEFEG